LGLNWEAVGAIAELLGALGVIGSLFYLASQIRQNTKSSRAATFQAVVSDAQRINALVIEKTEIARLRRVGLAEPEQLDPDDRIRFDRLMSTYFRFQDNLWEQRRNGTLDENQWEGYREVLRRLVTEPGARSYWAEHRESYSASFRTLMSSEFGL
jgi:hypothetical protein